MRNMLIKRVRTVFNFSAKEDWAPSQYINIFLGYRNFHYKDNMVVRLSYIYNGTYFTGKKASLYRGGVLGPSQYKDVVLPL